MHLHARPHLCTAVCLYKAMVTFTSVTLERLGHNKLALDTQFQLHFTVEDPESDRQRNLFKAVRLLTKNF